MEFLPVLEKSGLRFCLLPNFVERCMFVDHFRKKILQQYELSFDTDSVFKTCKQYHKNLRPPEDSFSANVTSYERHISRFV